MTGAVFPFRLPLVVIDFEATALTLDSHPIEVGIAVARSLAAAIEAWSALIASHPTWNLDDRWDPDAERVHGISRWQLRNGAAPRDVMQRLNDMAGGTGWVWCDGGHYDTHWLETLADAAGIAPRFVLCDIAASLNADPQLRERYREQLGRSAAPHRAGPDARRICAALVGALTVSAR